MKCLRQSEATDGIGHLEKVSDPFKVNSIDAMDRVDEGYITSRSIRSSTQADLKE